MVRKTSSKKKARAVNLAEPPESSPLLKSPHVLPKPWWGEGTAPHLRWPGVTIEIKAKWVPISGKLKLIGAHTNNPHWTLDGEEVDDWYVESGGRWEDGDYYFDDYAANQVCGFFEQFLTHSQGEFAGETFKLLDWQTCLIIRPIFGWKSKATGLRRFRKVYIEVPKKNGKSKLCAGLGVYMTFCDGEPGSQVYCAAADREQAAIVFDDARSMVEDCEELNEIAHVYRRSIVHAGSRSSFKVLSADARTKHGPNIHCLIFDELHAQPNRNLFETLEKGIAARRQPLIIMITTAGDDQESICYEQHEYGESVIKEGGDDTFLPVIFSTPKDADWTSMEVAAKVNPSFGITVKAEYLKNYVATALKEPRKQNNYKQLHLNVWTQQVKLWIPIENWDACKVEIDIEKLIGLPRAGGLDLSSKIDLSCFVLAFKHQDPPEVKPIEIEIDSAGSDADEEAQLAALAQIPTGEEVPEKKKLKIDFSVTLLPFFWMPAERLTERKKMDRFGYDVCSEAGLIDLTEGNIIDYDKIYEKVVDDLNPKFKLRDAEIGYDPWNATQLATQLGKKGFKMIEVPQTALHLSEASKIFEALVLAGRIRHSGHRVLRWNVENVSIKEDKSENIRPMKSSKMKRIDGVVASIIAISRLMVAKDTSGPVALWL